MASIVSDPNGYRRILFVAADGSRKTIRLGKATAKQADALGLEIILRPKAKASKTKG